MDQESSIYENLPRFHHGKRLTPSIQNLQFPWKSIPRINGTSWGGTASHKEEVNQLTCQSVTLTSCYGNSAENENDHSRESGVCNADNTVIIQRDSNGVSLISRDHHIQGCWSREVTNELLPPGEKGFSTLSPKMKTPSRSKCNSTETEPIYVNVPCGVSETSRCLGGVDGHEKTQASCGYSNNSRPHLTLPISGNMMITPNGEAPRISQPPPVTSKQVTWNGYQSIMTGQKNNTDGQKERVDLSQNNNSRAVMGCTDRSVVTSHSRGRCDQNNDDGRTCKNEVTGDNLIQQSVSQNSSELQDNVNREMNRKNSNKTTMDRGYCKHYNKRSRDNVLNTGFIDYSVDTNYGLGVFNPHCVYSIQGDRLDNGMTSEKSKALVSPSSDSGRESFVSSHSHDQRSPNSGTAQLKNANNYNSLLYHCNSHKTRNNEPIYGHNSEVIYDNIGQNIKQAAMGTCYAIYKPPVAVFAKIVNLRLNQYQKPSNTPKVPPRNHSNSRMELDNHPNQNMLQDLNEENIEASDSFHCYSASELMDNSLSIVENLEPDDSHGIHNNTITVSNSVSTTKTTHTNNTSHPHLISNGTPDCHHTYPVKNENITKLSAVKCISDNDDWSPQSVAPCDWKERTTSHLTSQTSSSPCEWYDSYSNRVASHGRHSRREDRSHLFHRSRSLGAIGVQGEGDSAQDEGESVPVKTRTKCVKFVEPSKTRRHSAFVCSGINIEDIESDSTSVDAVHVDACGDKNTRQQYPEKVNIGDKSAYKSTPSVDKSIMQNRRRGESCSEPISPRSMDSTQSSLLNTINAVSSGTAQMSTMGRGKYPRHKQMKSEHVESQNTENKSERIKYTQKKQSSNSNVINTLPKDPNPCYSRSTQTQGRRENVTSLKKPGDNPGEQQTTENPANPGIICGNPIASSIQSSAHKGLPGASVNKQRIVWNNQQENSKETELFC